MMLGIYEIAPASSVWDIPNVASRLDKKESAQRSARAIAVGLERVRGADYSERQWTIDAGVSPSFFSNLRGTPSKPPSDPSVDQLRQVLNVKQITLAEFFLDEARGRLSVVPKRQAVEQAFADALASMPSRAADRPRYLVEVVAGLLELPEGLPTTQADVDLAGQDDLEEAAPPRRATKRK